MPPDSHIVADLDQIIYLGAVADHRVFERAAIDAAVRADLDVAADQHPAELRHLSQAMRTGREAEAILTDAHAGMQDRTRADRAVG